MIAMYRSILWPLARASTNNSHASLWSSCSCNVVSKHYAPDKNQAIHRMISYRLINQTITSTLAISKNHLRPGGMAPSECFRSVRAIRDTPVADYSAPGVNTTRRVAYSPPIAVSPFLLPRSVSYFKQTVWRCGQL